MSEFDDFVKEASAEAAITAGESIIITGKTVNAVFSEIEMDSELERYGETERVTASAVISKTDLSTQPIQKTRIERVSDGVEWFVESVNEDAGHWELMLYRESKIRA